MRGRLGTLAKTFRHGSRFAFPLSGDDFMLLRGRAVQNVVIVSSSAMDVVDVNRRLVWRLTQGEYITGLSLLLLSTL